MPCDQWEFGGLHDRAVRESGLLPATTALIALELPAIDQPNLVALETRTLEPISANWASTGQSTLEADSPTRHQNTLSR